MYERTAFDGLAYQTYDNKSLLIIDSQMPGKPYTALQPVSYPFIFAYTGIGRLTFEEISNEEVWDELGNRAKTEPSETVNDHPCDVVSFTKPAADSKEMLWKVYAARDLGYYPIRRTSVHGKRHSVTDVTEWKVVPSALGDVVIPIKIMSETRDVEGRLTQSTSFAVSLKSVNVDLDDSLFSLKRFEPERTKYVDAPPKSETKRGGGLNFILAINVGVVILLLIAVLIKRRKWSPKAG